jgi:hypothetical protein
MSAVDVEETMTIAQIELRWFWLQRASARQQRIDEAAVARGAYRVMHGKSPDDP